MNYEEQLDIERKKLHHLRINIQISRISKVVERLRTKWNPTTKTVSAWGHDGTEKHVTMYYNEFSDSWTHEEQEAFNGYIFKEISKTAECSR